MWYLKLFLIFLTVIVLLLFGFINKGQMVTIHWWNSDGAGFGVDFILALFVAYFLGGITFSIIGGIREFRQRHRSGQVEKRLETATIELDALRTASLEGPLEQANRKLSSEMDQKQQSISHNDERG